MPTEWLDVSDVTPRIAYTATAAQTAFVVPFVFFEDEDLVVYQNTTLLTLATHYTVSGAEAEAGGTVTLLTGATLGDEIMIVRDVAIVQTTHIPPSGPLDIPAVNIQFSKLIAICQQIFNRLVRSIHFPDSDSTLSGELGSVATRKNKLLGFDTDGSLIYPLGPTFVGSTSEGVAVVDSRATAEVTTFDGSVNVVVTEGLVTPGDGGGAEYIRGLVSDPGAFQDAGAVYWVYASIRGAVVNIDTKTNAEASSFADNVNIINTSGETVAGDGGGSTYKRGAGGGSFTDAFGVSWVPFSSTAAATGPEGRLTLASGQPIMATSVTAATTLYYAPFTGTNAPINAGGAVRLFSFTASDTDAVGLSIVLGAAWVTNANFDVFVALNVGVVTLATGPDWSAGAVAGSNTVGSSTRGTGAGSTELQLFKGFMTNKNSITLRYANGSTFVAAANEALYLGSFRTGAAGQISFTYGANGTAGTFNLWNCYNQVEVGSTSSDSTSSWTYGSATIRQANASATNQFNFMVGLASNVIAASAVQNVRPASSAAAFGRFGIALNSTTVFDKTAQATNNAASAMDSSCVVSINYKPQLGANFISQNEAGDGSTTTTFIAASFQQLSVRLMM